MATKLEALTNLPLSPPAPGAAYFSEESSAWILSRHRDVLAALRSSDLSQARPPQKTGSDLNAKSDCPTIYPSPALANSYVSNWRSKIDSSAAVLLRQLGTRQPVDLVGRFILPWCLASAITLLDIDAGHCRRLAELVSHLSASDAAPQDPILKSRAKQANNELDRFFQSRDTPSTKSRFLGVAQTVPAFLASAWAALLYHPDQWRRLHAHPGWMPNAVEELLRYAGPVHSLFRHTDKETDIGGTKVRSGERMILRLGSANRDPEQFPEPDRLDITRRVAGHLALSAGPHSCVGASLVRVTTAVATKALLDRYSALELSGPVEWSCGTMLIWPSCLPVLGDASNALN